ncbi:ComEC family competence protein [Patescibacteria group bacterium AH-259-L05]|nr:ComEC family competence protein [Patescibacteria group bacterium AH-259-L05]
MTVSISKISFYSILFFIFGIGAASFLNIPFYVYIPLGLVILILARLGFFKKKLGGVLFIFFCLLFFILGVVRYQISFPKINENHVAFYNGSKITFQGKVIKEPDERLDKTKLTIGNIILKGPTFKSVKGKVLVNTPLYSGYEYGDIVEIECKLQEPGVIDRFNYHEYLARYDIYTTCYWPKITLAEKEKGSFLYSALLSVKARVKHIIDTNLSEPQSSFISALILGLKRSVPQQMRDWFVNSGTAHLLAVSGLHISILTKMLMIFLVSTLLIRRQHAFWLVFVLISLFVLLAGAPASAVRAGIMGLALLYAEKLGRPYSSMRILLLAAAAMLLINPKLLKADIGFQLSFTAVLGLYFLSPWFNSHFKNVPNLRLIPIRQYLSATLSAQIFVLPLILYYFGNFSLIAPIANILILSIMPLVMAFGFLFVIFGLIHTWLSYIILWPLWMLLTLVILVAKIGSSIPYASFVISGFPIIALIILYGLLIFWVTTLSSRAKRGMTMRSAERQKRDDKGE